MTGTNESSSGRGRRSKVQRLVDEYGLPGIGAELERMWTAEEDRYSLRQLAAYFNKELVRQQLEEENVTLLDGEVANTYRLLTDDDVSEADRTRVRRRLEREGIDVDALEGDFVTYQAIRTYLQKYRGAEYTTDEVEMVERESQNLQQLRGRIGAVAEGKLDQLRSGDYIELGEFRTLVTVQVICEECNAQYDVFDLLKRGGCDCQEQ